MQLVLPLRGYDWRWWWIVPAAIVGAVNVIFVGFWLTQLHLVPGDWLLFTHAADLIWSGAEPWSVGYRWSPVLAYALVVLSWMGPLAWHALHFAAALAFPTWRLRALVLLSWPFWADVREGNIMVFVALLAVYAVRGHRWAGLAYLALTIMVPRPLQVPVAMWLLWQRSHLCLPFAAMFALHGVAVLLTGYALSWLGVLLGTGPSLIEQPWNIGPSSVIGYWWLLIGLPLAAWLTWKGRLGLASLAASPYWLGYYGMMLALEFIRPVTRSRTA